MISAIAGMISQLQTVKMAAFTVECSLDLGFPCKDAKSNERPKQAADDDAAWRFPLDSGWSGYSADVDGNGIRREDCQPNESDSL